MTNINFAEITNNMVNRLADKDIILDVSTDTLITLIGWDEVETMGKEARADLYSYALDRADDKAWWDVCGLVGRYMDNEYYNDNIDAFLEYQSHMDEDDFDWDFYSDWHKDMYGYRPR